jgi:hypothetical protein
LERRLKDIAEQSLKKLVSVEMKEDLAEEQLTSNVLLLKQLLLFVNVLDKQEKNVDAKELLQRQSAEITTSDLAMLNAKRLSSLTLIVLHLLILHVLLDHMERTAE